MKQSENIKNSQIHSLSINPKKPNWNPQNPKDTQMMICMNLHRVINNNLLIYFIKMYR